MNFYFVPLANIDSVKYGTSNANLTGSNLFNDWKNPHRLYQSEVHALKELLNDINRESHISMILNLTSEQEE